MDSKVLFILVDPSQVNMDDIVGIKLHDKHKVKGAKLLRLRPTVYGKYEPIKVFFSNDSTETFDNIEELKDYFDVIN